jgi:hypothetical protein
LEEKAGKIFFLYFLQPNTGQREVTESLGKSGLSFLYPSACISDNVFFPSSRPQCYDQFKIHLQKSGFTLFPTEFDCPSSIHPFVDIAGKFGSHFWAFEYKSAGDNVGMAVEQATCYSRWFDYVVVVSEKWLDHRRSEVYWSLREIGAGLWNFVPETNRCISELNPELLSPEGRNHVSIRFKHLSKSKRKLDRRNQTTLDAYGLFLGQRDHDRFQF